MRELLHYRIVDKIGEGGMGEVWRATDTSLGRDVAIKMLPGAFAQDPERLARFEREAKLLASLNHANIASIYGLHADGAVRFLAMELVEGEDLAKRLERGPLPVDEALTVGVQIAAALEAAHGQGVVHRDLKPANVVITAEGKAKVLDFGLAKAAEPVASSGSASLSPTMTSAGTAAGMILGTAAYMSPEQARGKPVDRRADLWSFGVLLYECLTGLRLFRGETVSDSLAAILRKDPDLDALPSGTPPMVRLLLRRCLSRDPARRVQHAGDVRLELEQAIEDPTGERLGLVFGDRAATAAPRRLSRLPWTLAALTGLVALVLLVRGGPTDRAPTRAYRLTIPVEGPTEFGELLAAPPVVSPDGGSVVFGIVDETNTSSLWLRSLEAFEPRRLPSTEGAAYVFWSPDSAHIGFFRGSHLQRLELSTGRVQTLATVDASEPRGGSWSADDKILFVPNSNSGVHVVDATGGDAVEITEPDPDVPDSSHRWPQFLPDGEHFLFTFWTNDLASRQEHGGVYVATLDGSEPPRRLLPDPSRATWAEPGSLLVIRGDNLVAVPFDAEERRITGEAAVLTSGVLYSRSTGYAAFSASDEGTLVYATGIGQLPSRLVWYERSGEATPDPSEPMPLVDLRLGPDGRRAALVIIGESGDGQIWIADLARGVRSLLASASWSYATPVWSSAGDRLLYGSQERGSIDLYTKSADGSGEQQAVFVDDRDKTVFDWTADGKYVVYWPVGDGSGTSNVWVYSLEDERTVPLLTGDAAYTDVRFSPDGRWLAYVSDESGRLEVFVQAFDTTEDQPRVGGRWQLSTAGGEQPHWRADGREVVYVSPERKVMAVSLEPDPEGLALHAPHELFEIAGLPVALDATGDHQRFLVATREPAATRPLHVVLNWPAVL